MKTKQQIEQKINDNNIEMQYWLDEREGLTDMETVYYNHCSTIINIYKDYTNALKWVLNE